MIVLGVIISILTLNAKQISYIEQGDKLIEFFPPTVYMGDVQVWDVKAGDDGYVFFATSEGLSVYDGIRWLLPSSEKQKTIGMRTLFYDTIGKRLYCGGDNYFGYWERDNFGLFVYTNLYQNSEYESPKMFWRIGRVGDQIYFGAKEAVFCYNLKTAQITSLNSEKGFHFMHVVGNDVFVQEGDILYMIEGQEKKALPMKFTDRVTAIYPDAANGRLLVFREEAGMYYLSADLSSLTEVNSNTNRLIGKQRIFSVVELTDNTYLLGSILGGLFHVDEKGNILRRVNKNNGLPYVSVLNVSVDSYNNIWMGLEGGIAKLDNVSSESYLIDYNNEIGGVYAVFDDHDKLYIGTNKGIFYRDRDNHFHFMDGTQGQTWSLSKIGDELIACHDAGMFRLQGEKAYFIRQDDGIWGVLEIPFKPGWYLSYNYHGFNLYQKINGKLVYKNKIKDFKGETRLSVFDKYNFLWVMATGVGFYRFSFSDDLEIINSKLYRLPDMSDGVSFISVIDKEVIFYTGEKAYSYDSLKDSLVIDNYAQSLLKQCGNNIVSFKQFGNTFWYMTKNDVGYIIRNHNQMQIANEVFANSYDKRIPYVFQSIVKLSDGSFAYGLQNRIAINKSMEIVETNNVPKLSTVEFYDQGNMYYADTKDMNIVLPYSFQGLKIHLNNLGRSKLIEYRIVDKNKDWISVRADKGLELPNLETGVSKVEIRNYGEESTPYLQFTVTIKAPWYFSGTFITIYIVILIVFIVAIYRIHWLYTQKAVAKREQKLLKKVERQEKERLEQELKEKDKKLAGFMMDELNKNNLLTDIKKMLADSLNTNNPKETIRTCITSIDKKLNNQEDWRIFLKYFNNIHDGYVDRLTEKYPQLSLNDLKLCTYLKLNLSTKEISVLLNISPASVDTARHRLRKKLSLSNGDSLSAFLAAI